MGDVGHNFEVILIRCTAAIRRLRNLGKSCYYGRIGMYLESATVTRALDAEGGTLDFFRASDTLGVLTACCYARNSWDAMFAIDSENMRCIIFYDLERWFTSHLRDLESL